MMNHRLAALLFLFACVILPMAMNWLFMPGINWIRPYLLWGMVVVIAWLWQRRRRIL